MKTHKLLLPLKNVHDLLSESALSKPLKVEGTEFVQFRYPEDKKRELDGLCRRHGTTMSAFLRACADQVVEDYMP